MNDPKQQGFKTLLDEVRGNNPKSLTVPEVRGSSLRRLGKDLCPHLRECICGFSEKFRRQGTYPCTGRWFETCQVYLLVKNSDGDPTALILED